jgi:DNA helicase-2/ATP-dependent DNA helicase PcrA
MPGQPAPSLSFGISLHNVMKDYYQALINKEEVNQKALEAMLQERWINEGYQSKEHAKSAFAHAKEVLVNYIKQNENQTNLPIARELPFQYNIKNLKILGRIDRIDRTTDGKLEIIDYKTGDRIPDEKKLKEDLQLTMYALAATKMNDAIFKDQTPEGVMLSLYYLEKGIKLTTVRTKEQLLEAEELILKKVEEIENSSFECRGGIFCKTCEYKMICQTSAG